MWRLGDFLLRIGALLGLAGLLWAALPGGVRAEERKVYFFGNSLIHHLSGSDETAVPHWLALMARAGGHGFAADGQWGFLRDFARSPPEPNWSFRAVEPALRGGDFARSGIDAIVVNPANFVQYQPPERRYDGDNPDRASPLSAMLALIDAHAAGRVLYLYEGWAEMAGVAGGFPPGRRGLARYHAYNRGAYHEWYEDFAAALRAARPGQEVVLIPVARVLSELMSAPPLDGLGAEQFYSDDAPHGTPSTYLLAAAVTYQVLYGEPAPADMALPETIAPELRAAWPALVARIAELLGAPQQAAAPQAAPGGADRAAGLADPALAMGLNGITDWTTQHPFVDLMKTARPWLGHEGESWGAWDMARLAGEGFLDAEGWPRALPPGVDRLESFVLTDQPEAVTALEGRYRLRWQGAGELRLGGRARRVEYGRNEAWFSYVPGDGLVAVTITATDPQGTGDHIRAIELVREDQVVLHELGVIFNPDWIARIADLRSLRFMDWMLTNGSPVSTWDERPQVADFSYGWRGVPLEVMVELANFVGADPWFNMPHGADDAYVRQFAALVHARLDPRLKAWVEYSNELWNHIFPQAQWAGEQARRRWGGKAGDDAWMQFAGLRAAQVMQIWGEVFEGGDAARLVRVVAVHTGWMGLEEPLLTAPLWVAEDPAANKPPAEYFDAYAVTGYFGFELGLTEEGRLDDLRGWIAESREIAEAGARQRGLQRKALEAAVAPVRFERALPRAAQAVREGSLRELAEAFWPYHRDVAARHGLALVMYEGGTHAVGHGAAINDEELTAFFHAFNYSAEMAALYEEALAAWAAAGGRLFNAFVDVAPPSRFGSYGALRHLQDANPRWDALMAANAAGAPGAARDPGAFLHGVVRRGGPRGEALHGTPEEDILIAGPGDDRLEGGGGGDFMDGGAGRDVAVLPGLRAEYRFAMQAGRLLAMRGAQESRLRGIEALEFEGEPGRTYRLDLPE